MDVKINFIGNQDVCEDTKKKLKCDLMKGFFPAFELAMSMEGDNITAKADGDQINITCIR